MKAKPEQTPTYAAAVDELDRILDEIESGEVDIDTLSVKVERAAQLIVLCREKLAGTEMRVTKVLEQLDADLDGAGAGDNGADQEQ